MGKDHKINCGKCGQEIDMRDLSQVFAHEPCDGIPKDYSKISKVEYSASQKIGDFELHTKSGVVNLN